MKKILYVFALICAVMLSSCNKDALTPAGDKTNLWPAGKNHSRLYGFINKSGEMVIPAKYKTAHAFSCGWALVIDEDGEYMFIDKSGNKGKATDKDEVGYNYYFYYNLFTFTDGDYQGMWDKNFNVVIKADYEGLGAESPDGLIAYAEDASDDEGWGFLNDKGQKVIEPQFHFAYSFQDGMAVVIVKEGKKDDPKYYYGVVDKGGNFIVEPQKNGLMSMGEGRLGMQKSTGKVVLCDKNLEEISSSYDNGDPFSCGMARVKKAKEGESAKYGYINAKGEEVISCRFASAYTFGDDVAWVKKDADSKWELIDKNGESLLKLKEDEYPSGNFRNGLGMVYIVDKETYERTYRYINKSGETIYKWTPGDDEEEDEAPKMDWEELDRMSVMASDKAPLFINAELAKKNWELFR